MNLTWPIIRTNFTNYKLIVGKSQMNSQFTFLFSRKTIVALDMILELKNIPVHFGINQWSMRKYLLLIKAH